MTDKSPHIKASDCLLRLWKYGQHRRDLPPSELQKKVMREAKEYGFSQERVKATMLSHIEAMTEAARVQSEERVKELDDEIDRAIEQEKSHKESIGLKEWQNCIKHTHADKAKGFGETWCGRVMTFPEWCFLDIDHAAYTMTGGSRLEPCPKCVEAIVAALTGEEIGRRM